MAKNWGQKDKAGTQDEHNGNHESENPDRQTLRTKRPPDEEAALSQKNGDKKIRQDPAFRQKDGDKKISDTGQKGRTGLSKKNGGRKMGRGPCRRIWQKNGGKKIRQRSFAVPVRFRTQDGRDSQNSPTLLSVASYASESCGFM